MKNLNENALNVTCEAKKSYSMLIFLYVSGIKNLFEWLSRMWQFIIGECCLCRMLFTLHCVLKSDFLSKGKRVMKLFHYCLRLYVWLE